MSKFGLAFAQGPGATEALLLETDGRRQRGDSSTRGLRGFRAAAAVCPQLRESLLSAVQLEGIDELFQQQTQVGGKGLGPDAALQGSLEAAVAIFGSHPGNHQLLLKTSQFLSLLLAEPNAQQQLPMAVLFQAAQAVSAVSVQLLADAAAAGSEGLSAQGKAGSPSPAKLLTWFLSLLALVLPGLGAKLRDRPASEQFVQELLGRVVAQLLGAAGPQQDALALKAAQVLPSLPPEPWVQEAFLESGVVHSLALARRRCADAPPDAPLPHALHAAARGAFSDNLDLCVKALEDMFVSEEFVCLLVLDELQVSSDMVFLAARTRGLGGHDRASSIDRAGASERRGMGRVRPSRLAAFLAGGPEDQAEPRAPPGNGQGPASPEGGAAGSREVGATGGARAEPAESRRPELARQGRQRRGRAPTLDEGMAASGDQGRGAREPTASGKTSPAPNRCSNAAKNAGRQKGSRPRGA
ncbi:unnamed protein product [Prorocentrum cordatum]|uniref:Uncharacterized protein n=1 Tax=Prorocentrum cordatum TaxID=2364126 RepID=A0ABN9R7Z5_9DINO|nr:unnamed protein product [Polarella glacialis]